MLLGVVVVATAASAATPIGDLVSHPAPYADTTVTIEGRVVGLTIPYRSEVGYTVQGSDDARVNVVARGASPAQGAHLRVTGTVAYRPPDEEFTFPPLIVESSRETLP